MKFNQKPKSKLSLDQTITSLEFSGALFFTGRNQFGASTLTEQDIPVYENQIAKSVHSALEIKARSGMSPNKFWYLYFTELIFNNTILTGVAFKNSGYKLGIFLNKFVKEIENLTPTEKLEMCSGFGNFLDDFNNFRSEMNNSGIDVSEFNKYGGLAKVLAKHPEAFKEIKSVVFGYAKVFILGKLESNVTFSNTTIDNFKLKNSQPLVDINALDGKKLEKWSEVVRPMVELNLRILSDNLNSVNKTPGFKLGLKDLFGQWVEDHKNETTSIFYTTSMLFKKGIWGQDSFEDFGFIDIINGINSESSIDKHKLFMLFVDGLNKEKEGN